MPQGNSPKPIVDKKDLKADFKSSPANQKDDSSFKVDLSGLYFKKQDKSINLIESLL